MAAQAPGPVWRDTEKHASTEIRSPDLPARSDLQGETHIFSEFWAVGPDIQTQYLFESLRNLRVFWAVLSSPACRYIEPKYVFQICVVTEPYRRSPDAARLYNDSPERLDISVSSRQIAELYSLLRTRIPAFRVL